MAQVLIRNVDPGIFDKLKDRAHRNSRALEAELRVIITAAVDDDRERVRVEVGRIQTLFSGRTFTDSAHLVRDDRAR